MRASDSDVSVPSDREIVISRLLAAPRSLVFKAWTDPAQVVQWWGPRGFTTTIQEMDVRPGGVWRFVMHGPDGTDYDNKIVFIEVVEPERLSTNTVPARRTTQASSARSPSPSKTARQRSPCAWSSPREPSATRQSRRSAPSRAATRPSIAWRSTWPSNKTLHGSWQGTRRRSEREKRGGGRREQPAMTGETSGENGLLLIRKVVEEAERVQNDPESFAILLTDAVVLVNAVGRRISGRDQVLAAMREAMKTSLANVLTRNEIVDIRFLRPDVALVSGIKHISGEGGRSSPQRFQGNAELRVDAGARNLAYSPCPQHVSPRLDCRTRM